ncbi:type VII secretion-associated serine protease mycosin [Streptomyces radicis]|uniref:Type VII secretion-associated serine protease mycosin n=1 Tax=Streptomyces radicis TaxID=1750517 RepID=A0A3A9W0N7_9ACTN|nr:type VII secretion-associated serine protease mycosin [Streptomyces radicis]RKN06718.1 type VII secretion-associated serine protease mycosin [Streptomyces radicis]RKN19344.1 type VII secretion-associated serine protease mycosin [Streptomyces radicis]
MARRLRARAALTALLLTALGTVSAPPAAHADGGRCAFPAENIEERPWALQRVLLDRLWQESRGEGVSVAVIDTGVDTAHPQLAGAVDAARGADFTDAEGDQTTDTVGHGTKVAGIIAARPHDDTGFVGLAPDATIVPIRQNDADGSGSVATLADAIDHAVGAGVDIINISQDSDAAPGDDSELARAVNAALDADIVVIASVGNDGADGERRLTYPAAYDGVLAVAASDRNNERAPFSQSGDFVGIAAPGVDMVSTVPLGGQCVDSGTSFAAPYVAGVAALLRAEQPEWTAEQIVTHLKQTAERAQPGPDADLGWGVVDPVRALTRDTAPPGPTPVPDPPAPAAPAPDVEPLDLGETHAERAERLGTFVILTATLLTAALAGTALIIRDHRHRNGLASMRSDRHKMGSPR